MWYAALQMPQNTTESMMPDHTTHGRNKFEWLFLGEASRITHSYDRPIWETDHFAVLPSLGSIVSGWLLIVPKFPVCQIADVDSCLRDEFEALAHKTIRSVERDFGRAYLFEHGGSSGSKISCGVDQAHLHIVPLDFDLVDMALTSKPGSWDEVDQLSFPYDLCDPDEYWYVSNQERTMTMAISDPQSQWFRKLIATKTGHPERWDYNQHPFFENIEKTRKAIGANG